MKTVKDVFEAICGFEERVGKFYDSISDEVRGGYGKFFEKLAADEYRHAKIYTRLGEMASENETVILSDEDAEYIKNMFDNSVIGENFDFDKFSKIRDKWQVLDIAERVEREATGYVQDVMGFFPDFAPDEVKILLKEEREHLKMILEKKNQMSSGFLGL
ncbi:MAG: hypothetical protein GX079_02895 [Tissierellia bacterium]|nr:hypothetical protein [Tissierellia bacterium]